MTATALKFKNPPRQAFIVSAQQRVDVLQRHGLSERLVDERERLAITGISRSTWRRLEQKRLVPLPKKIDVKNRYLLSEIMLFLERP